MLDTRFLNHLCGLLGSIAGLLLVVGSVELADGRPPRPPPVPVWHDFPDETPYLKTYQTNGWTIVAGFVPDQVEYVWGEPIHFITFVVRNAGTNAINFSDGGDYRGGRSTGHQLSAVDAEGRAVEVPEMHNMGGMVNIEQLAPGETYRKLLPVERRFVFKGPGVYTVTGCRTLNLATSFGDERFDDTGLVPVATTNTFQLTIQPNSPARMAKVVERLAARIRANGAIAPRPTEYTEPTEFSPANQQWLDLTTLAGLKSQAARDGLTALAGAREPTLRGAALRTLGRLSDDGTERVVLRALHDPQPAIRCAAAEALGNRKTQAAVTGLLDALPGERPEVASAILRALGHTQSPRAWKTILPHLTGPAELRWAAVDAAVAFGGQQAVDALLILVGDADLDLREYVIHELAESLHQPIDPFWLVPVIQSRNGQHSIGEAPTLMRLHGGERAVPALLSALDFGDPSIRKYYNWEVIYEQGWCRGGLKIPWISDRNRNDTPAEIAGNTRTLQILKGWLEHYRQHRMTETPPAPSRGWADDEKTYSDPVDDLRIRAAVNQRVWPEGLPQLITFVLLGASRGGSVQLSAVPPALELEINGQWYVHQPPLTGPTQGLDVHHGSSYHNIFPDEHWVGKTDGRPLRLGPGRYTARVALSRLPAEKRTGLAVSKPVTFEVISVGGS